MRWWLLAGALAGALLVAAACNGGDGPPKDTEELLRLIVLRLEDLPEGYTGGEGTFSSNEDVALGDEEKLAELEAQGRLLGFGVDFARGDVPAEDAPFFGIESSANLYESADGASDSFDLAVTEARETDWEAQLGFGETQTQEIDRSLADATFWLRVTGVAEIGDPPTSVLVMDDHILLRHGRARAYLRVSSAIEGSSDRDALIEEVAKLAELEAQRMKDSLD
jgi:hypothetical protein